MLSCRAGRDNHITSHLHSFALIQSETGYNLRIKLLNELTATQANAAATTTAAAVWVPELILKLHSIQTSELTTRLSAD